MPPCRRELAYFYLPWRIYVLKQDSGCCTKWIHWSQPPTCGPDLMPGHGHQLAALSFQLCENQLAAEFVLWEKVQEHLFNFSLSPAGLQIANSTSSPASVVSFLWLSCSCPDWKISESCIYTDCNSEASQSEDSSQVPSVSFDLAFFLTSIHTFEASWPFFLCKPDFVTFNFYCTFLTASLIYWLWFRNSWTQGKDSTGVVNSLYYLLFLQRVKCIWILPVS